MGKGDGRRPPAISDAEFSRRWSETFKGTGDTSALEASVELDLPQVDTSAQGSDITGT